MEEIRLTATSGPAREATVRLLESVFELSGESMAPTLERGWKVRVEPMDRPPEAGMLVLIDVGGKPLIHRVLGTVTWGSPPQQQVVHAGDSSFLPGIVPASFVRGRICAVVHPRGQRLPSAHELPRKTRARHSRFLTRCKVFASLRRSAEALPGLRRLPITALSRACRRLLRIG